MAIIPSARGLFACHGYERHKSGEISLTRIFNSVQTQGQFPFKMGRFYAFAQLLQGLGEVPCWLELHRAEDNALIWLTNTNILTFESREKIVQMAMAVDRVVFERPGVYLLELYCDNNWVCDTRLQVI
jgi:hypothetical protein